MNPNTLNTLYPKYIDDLQDYNLKNKPIFESHFSTNQNTEIIEITSVINNYYITPTNNFYCKVPGCNKQYSSKSRLSIHIRTHVIITYLDW